MNRRMMWLTAIVLMLVSIAPVGAAIAQEGEGLLIWADDTRAPIMEVLGTEFAEEYGIPVTVQELGFGDIRDNIQVAGPAGEGADIFIGAHDWLGELYTNGVLAPIDLGDKAELFSPVALQAFIIDGVLYGMPYAVENVAFFYNPELVPEAPATWSEVTEVAANLEAENENIQYAMILRTGPGDPYHFYPTMTAFGGYVFGLDEAGNYNPDDLGIDDEGSLAAANWLQMMTEEGHTGPDIDYDVAHTLFETGQGAMLITGPWALPRIRDSGIPYAIANIPSETETGAPFLGVQGFMISAFSENQLLAQVFLTEYVATEETMMAIFGADPRPSAFLPALEKIEDPDIVALGQAGLVGQPMPAIPQMSAVWTAWGDAITLVAQQQQTAEEAFTNAAAQIRNLIAGLGKPPTSVTAVGNFQALLGCAADWDPACEATMLSDEDGDGFWTGEFTLPAGDYEGKIALNGSWAESYPADNIMFTLTEETTFTVVYNQDAHTVTGYPE
jgi:arabinogalactan oligomer/maltooligosaccharide transport system substrate-binding protein